MKQGKLIIFSAPSGSGKSTIVNALIERGIPMEFSISATSRLPRGSEKDGVHYYFLSPESFTSKVKNNLFLEWEEVYKSNYYGTLSSEVDRIWSKSKHVLFDVDVKDTLSSYHFFLNLRNRKSYPYSNFYFFLHLSGLLFNAPV